MSLSFIAKNTISFFILSEDRHIVSCQTFCSHFIVHHTFWRLRIETTRRFNFAIRYAQKGVIVFTLKEDTNGSHVNVINDNQAFEAGASWMSS